MNFLNFGGFFFALALPVVVVFYLLKRKRVVKLVPSTLLWQRFMAESQASAPFQKLRHNWLLLLQLLLLALVVLAIARPFFTGNASSASLQVVVLDSSASMQSTDESPTRFEKAKSEALKLIEGLNTRNGQRMILMVAGANSEVKQSPTSDKSALRRALQEAMVTDSSTHLVDALRVAETLTRNNSKSEIHLFSDGAVSGLEEFETKDLKLTYHRVGQRVNNAGIVSLDVKANPEDPSKRAIFTSIANFSMTPVDSTVELSFEGRSIETKPVQIGPTNTVPLIFIANQPSNGVFTVRLNHADDLAADNQASMASLLPQPVQVLLVTKGNRFLEKALASASPHIEVTTAPNYADAGAKYDMVVLDDVAPSTWPSGNVLAIHVANTNWFEGGIGQIEGPPIVDWKNTHPLLRFTSFDSVSIAQSLQVKTPPWAVSLVDSPSSPLLLAGELGRQRVVWIGFDTLQSTWPLRISFPIFIANAVDWLNPTSARMDRFLLRAGETFRMPLEEAFAVARIVGPDAKESTVPLGPAARELVFGATSRQGSYHVHLGTNEFVFCANILDSDESNTQPRPSLNVGKFNAIAESTTKRANLEYWRWFAMAGLAVMMFEWWWFHRRTA
jgi:hypothetical protein